MSVACQVPEAESIAETEKGSKVHRDMIQEILDLIGPIEESVILLPEVDRVIADLIENP